MAGRRSKYTPEMPKLAEKYAQDGYSDSQIAGILGITQSTFYDWQKRHPEFSEAIKRGKAPANRELELAMMKSATGYYVDEEETTAILDGQTKQPTSYRKTTRKRYIPPVPTMQIFLAKNRMPDEYRDVNKHEVDLRGQLGVKTLAELIMEDEDRKENG